MENERRQRYAVSVAAALPALALVALVTLVERPLASLAVAVQLVSVFAIRSLFDGAFDVPPVFDEAVAVRTSYAILLMGGLLSGALGAAGAYTAVLRLRPAFAVPLVLCVYAPIVFVAMTALYGVLVLLACV